MKPCNLLFLAFLISYYIQNIVNDVKALVRAKHRNKDYKEYVSWTILKTRQHFSCGAMVVHSN